MGANQAKTCKDHPGSPNGFYCINCKSVLCVKCRINGFHPGHEIRVLKNLAFDLMEEYEKFLSTIKQEFGKLVQQPKSKSIFNEVIGDGYKIIDRNFDKITEIVENCRLEYKTKFEKWMSREYEKIPLTQKFEKLPPTLHKLKSEVEEILAQQRKSYEEEDYFGVCEGKESLLNNYSKILTQNIKELENKYGIRERLSCQIYFAMDEFKSELKKSIFKRLRVSYTGDLDNWREFNCIRINRLHEYEGKSSKKLRIFDTHTEKWEEINFKSRVSLPELGFGSCENRENEIYISGGMNCTEHLSTVLEYIEERNEVVIQSQMQGARSYHGMVCTEHALYTLGGEDSRGSLRSCEKYILHTNSPLLSASGSSLSLNASLNSSGLNTINTITHTLSPQQRLPNDTKWEKIPSMSECKDSLGACVFQRRYILVFGGYCVNKYTNIIERLDTREEREWEILKLPNHLLFTPRQSPGCFPLSQQDVLLFGGYADNGDLQDSFIFTSAMLSTHTGGSKEVFAIREGGHFLSSPDKFTKAAYEYVNGYLFVNGDSRVHIYHSSMSKWTAHDTYNHTPHL